MADTKVSALTAAGSALLADEIPVNEAGTSKKVTVSQIRQAVGAGLTNASTAAVSAGYATDTYLAGSAITIPTAGGWVVGTSCLWQFDMTKTALGTAAGTIIVRMGTLGTQAGDPAILTFTWAVGTAVADTGLYTVGVTFRTVGSGTSAVIAGYAMVNHHLAATGLTTTGASGTGILVGTSAGFASTTQTIIGLSYNGGASFSGTNTIVTASAVKI